MTVVSHELLEAGRSDRGSWSKRQLQLLGASYPLRTGWKQQILGREISEQAAAEFIALKNQHLKPDRVSPEQGPRQRQASQESRPTATPARREPPSSVAAPATAAEAAVIAYTDGACSGNPGPGGWGAVLVWPDGRREELSGSATGTTTNNRMEIAAAIAALQALPPGSYVRLHSDSQLVINTMTRGWRRRVNQDLWDELDRWAAQHRVEWIWVKGHASDPLNQRADTLAVAAAKRAQLG